MANMHIGKPFIPVIGKCYDIRFGKIKYKEQEALYSARVRINGISPAQWEDLDTGHPLDPGLGSHTIQAHKEIPGL